jgi:hypothetical protein
MFTLAEPMPADCLVSTAVDAYLAENGFKKGDYDAPSVKVTFWGISFNVPNPPSRQIAVRFHDLHHIVTGYGTDPTGEAEISAWEFGNGLGVFSGVYVKGIVTSGFLFGLIHSPLRTLSSWRAGRRGPGLINFSMSVYADLLHLSVAELRARYGISDGGLTTARRLHYDAPPNSKDA